LNVEGSTTPWVEADLIIKGSSEVLTCAPDARDSQGRLSVGRIPDGAVAAREGRIVWVGTESACM
jgi:imidazolonepropionase-like amidohydrolase